MDTVKVGTFIAALRREKGWTQEELGTRVGVTNKTVSRWENGNYMPAIDVLMLLSDEFQVSLNELVHGRRLESDDFQAAADKNLASALEKPSQRFLQWLERRGGWLAVGILLGLFLFAVGFLYFQHLQANPSYVKPPGTFVCRDLPLPKWQNLTFHRTGKYYIFDGSGYYMEVGDYTQEGDLIRLDSDNGVRWAVLKGRGLYATNPESGEMLFYQWNGEIPLFIYPQSEIP